MVITPASGNAAFKEGIVWVVGDLVQSLHSAWLVVFVFELGLRAQSIEWLESVRDRNKSFETAAWGAVSRLGKRGDGRSPSVIC